MNKTLDKVDMIDLWRKLNGNRKECTFFSEVHDTYTKIDQVLGHKNLTIQCRKAEIVNASFSDHNAIKIICNQRPWKCKPKINQKLNKYPKNNFLKDDVQVLFLITAFRLDYLVSN